IQLLDRARRIPFFKLTPAFISHLPDLLTGGPHLASAGSCQGVAQSAKHAKTPFRVVDFPEVACYGAAKLEFIFVAPDPGDQDGSAYPRVYIDVIFLHNSVSPLEQLAELPQRDSASPALPTLKKNQRVQFRTSLSR